MNVGPTATKKNVLEQLLEQGMVLIALDARSEGVDVPEHLGKDPQLRLNLSYRFGLPMAIDEWGVNATLTFAGIPYSCRFPWKSMFLMVSHVSGQPYLFPDDIPTELLTQGGIEGTEVQTPASTTPHEPKAERPKLKLVNSDPEPASKADDDDEAAAATDKPDAPAVHAKPEAAPVAPESHTQPDVAPTPVAPQAAPSPAPAPAPAEARAEKDEPPDEPPPPSDNDSRSKSTKRRGHLRLVK